ncbi:hypothetical protein HMPREF0970_01318 [Schaalia odontolytica F0309]|uniref:Uncharacterized protein n=1 Tax=Schaalia odontolytica F0309 TaxID=649742 RepID=D4TZD7_9ACTO|nr:hypothetical protein HMPREF0970_01318 [Schaalia odontolytica F0309]
MTRRGRGRLSLSRVAGHGRVVCARRRGLPMPRASVRRRARTGAYSHDWSGA